MALYLGHFFIVCPFPESVHYTCSLFSFFIEIVQVCIIKHIRVYRKKEKKNTEKYLKNVHICIAFKFLSQIHFIVSNYSNRIFSNYLTL